MPSCPTTGAPSGSEREAYRRLTERALAMFHSGDALARFLYRG